MSEMRDYKHITALRLMSDGANCGAWDDGGAIIFNGKICVTLDKSEVFVLTGIGHIEAGDGPSNRYKITDAGRAAAASVEE